jgi:uncharacterized RDD family membrane protein YckC
VTEYEPATAGTGPSGPRAGWWSRVGAYLLDNILLAVPYVILLLLFDDALAYALYLAVSVAYFAYFEGGETGQTLGKRALGIRVIDFSSGGPIGYGRGVIRYIGKVLSSLALGIGFLWMLWDREKQTWEDKLATTVVVPTSAYPVS